jgi:hypothetical protein
MKKRINTIIDIAGITAIILLFVCMANASYAQTFQRTIDADTIDVSALSIGTNDVTVDTLTDAPYIRIIETVDFVNCSNETVKNRLQAVGYFDLQTVKTGRSVSVSDHSEKSIEVAGQQLEIRRKYQVLVPVGKAVVNQKPK